MNTTHAPLTTKDRAQLLQLARHAITAFLSTGRAPAVNTASFGERLSGSTGQAKGRFSPLNDEPGGPCRQVPQPGSLS